MCQISLNKRGRGRGKGKMALAAIILKKCVDLCDDMISVILTFLGFNNGISGLRKCILKESLYENYKQYRLRLHAMFINKSLEICNILYKKLSNYTVVQIALVFPIIADFNIDYLRNRIIKIYNNLCNKTVLRYDYELRMSYYNLAFRKALIHFLKFDYPSLDIERKKYLPVFEVINGMDLFYA